MIILGIVIGSNNFAVALALGALGQAKHRYRIMLIFGLFEFVVPLTGIWLGSAAASALGVYSNLVGAIALSGLGLFTVIEGLRDKSNDKKLAQHITSWSGLILLAATLSIDNLIVGFSLGFGQANPLTIAGTIAVFAVFFTWLGLEVGDETRRRWEQVVEISAGVLLVMLGTAIYFGWL